MDLIGIWKCVEMNVFDPKTCSIIWKTTEEINADPELRESIGNAFEFVDINADGTVKWIMAIPEDVPQEEIDEALASGELVKYDDNHFAVDIKPWKIVDGVFKYDSGMKGEVLGEAIDPWQEVKIDGDIIELGMFRFARK